jgi:import inner membrane translocase subunit TIM21
MTFDFLKCKHIPLSCENAHFNFSPVKETTKTASYLGVILAGVGVTAVIFYQVFRELFSSKSPNSVYTTSLKKCCADSRVIDSLGEPIKGFGEETRRGRRRHVRYVHSNTEARQQI